MAPLRNRKGHPQRCTVAEPVCDVLVRVVDCLSQGAEDLVSQWGRRMVKLAVARVKAQGGADLPAREGDDRRRGWRARRMGPACQVAVPESRELVHGGEQGVPDAGGGCQKARLGLYEGGWVPGAGGALIIFCTASGPA